MIHNFYTDFTEKGCLLIIAPSLYVCVCVCVNLSDVTLKWYMHCLSIVLETLLPLKQYSIFAHPDVLSLSLFL